ncbi:MAG TPA: hypothetical protein VN155_16670 [Devosia sp.]|nr:hypothetical protein [Devosia sp.]
MIYRPPEDFDENRFYRQGDIYQIGVLLYELCGGVLHKNERDWLKPSQQRSYDVLTGYDQQAFANGIIEDKIRRGKILAWDSVPAWVSPRLRSIIRRAAAVARERRFDTVADLIATLNNARRQIFDWRIENGVPQLAIRNKVFRIVEVRGQLAVEKRLAGNWRTERQWLPKTMADAVSMVEQVGA